MALILRTFLSTTRKLTPLLLLTFLIQSALVAQITSTSGAWGSTSTWQGGAVPGAGSTVNVNHAVTLDRNISIIGGTYNFYENVTDAAGGSAYTLSMAKSGNTSGTLDIKSGTTTFEGSAAIDDAFIYVRSGATLIVGGLTINNNSTIRVEAGGTLIVYGNVIDANNGQGSTIIEGYVMIYGSYTATTGSVQIAGGGSLESTGPMITNGNSTIFGSQNDCTTGPCSGASLHCGVNGSSYTNSITPSTQTICAGQTPAVLSANTNAPTPTYQWQVSTTSGGSGFTDISGATSSTYSPAALSQNTWYRVIMTTDVCVSTSPSSAINVVATTPPAANAGSAQTICAGSSATLAANDPAPGSGAWSIISGPNTATSQLSSVTNRNATFTPTATGAYVLRWTISLSPCASTTSDVSINIQAAEIITWVGNNGNQNWSNPMNWSCPAVPGIHNNVVIPAGTNVVVDVPAISKNLTVEAGASFTLANAATLSVNGDFINTGTFNGGTGQLAITGDFVNNSTFNAQQGSVLLNGTTNQILNAGNAILYTVEIGKPNGTVTLTSPLRLAHLFQVNSATTVVSNGNLEILSLDNTTANDGSIGPLPEGAAITGAVKVNRYIKAEGLINRYISFPVQGVTSTQLTDDFKVATGSIRQYNEPTAGVKNNGYANASLTAGFQRGRGYLAWMYNNVNTTLDIAGAIYSGSIPLPVTHTVTTGGESEDGWNLVGNPYASAIKWDITPEAGAFTLTNIESMISVPDLSTGDPYPTYFKQYNAADGSGNLPGGVVAMGQAFWVHATNPTTSLIIHENAKVTSDVGRFYRTKNAMVPSEQLNITIRNEKRSDNAFFKLNPEATEGYDRFDGYKLMNPELNVYLLDNASRNLAMHTLNEIPSTQNIRIGVVVAEAGTYYLSIGNETDFSYGNKLVFIDSYAGKAIPLSEVKDYSFQVNDVTKALNDRFFLTYNAETIKAVETELAVYPNPVRDLLRLRSGDSKPASAELYTQQGKLIERYSFTAEGTIDMSSLPQGVYVLKINTTAGQSVRRVVKQ